ncbi:MAG: hypothetical protein HC915_01085 [Anaerolineae bacterium]|nr:hypothetical protein [Anaerolineae bacterium]
MATSQEKIIAYYISRLRDKRPEVQREAIQGLEAIGAEAEEALEPLKALYESAAEEAIRRMAQLAAYNIFMAVKHRDEGQ